MNTKRTIGALILALAATTSFAQGLTSPTRMHSPRLADPSRLSVSERSNRIGNRNNARRFNRSSPSLLGVYPDRVFNLDDVAIRINQSLPPGANTVGTPGAISAWNFGNNGTALGDLLLPGDPRDPRDFGYNAYARDTGFGNLAAGVGTGSGNQFAGIGAYYYGQGAGLGMFASGMGDYMAGQGRLLEGQGNYEHSSSLANINNEEAEYRDTKNDEYHASAFFNKRKTNLEARRYEQEMQRYAVNRLSTEQIAKLQQQRAPERLSFQHYDEVTGALAWPTLLRNDYFAEARQEINRLFAIRTKLGASTGLGSDNYREIRRKTQQLENDLRATMPDMTPMEYTMAKNFLRSLEFEAQHPLATAFPVARVADAR